MMQLVRLSKRSLHSSRSHKFKKAANKDEENDGIGIIKKILKFKIIKSIENWVMASLNQQVSANIFIAVQPNYFCSQPSMKIIREGQLTLSLGSNELIFTLLTDDQLIIKNSKGQCFSAELNFSTKFQVISQNQSSIKSRKLGFKILRDNSTESVEFYQTNQVEINEWIKALSTRMSRVGFHQHFKAIKRLGKGQFATVFEVQDLQNNLRYAVKAFSKSHLLKTPKGMESLVNQIKIMRSFSHKNLLKLHSVFQSDNSIYLVTDLFKGGSLFDRVQKLINNQKMGFKMENIRQFMSGLFQGLCKLQQIGVAHRDLKLDNIMLRSMNSFDPIIIDFGLATFVDDDEYIYYRCGTPGYVSPEVMSSSKVQKIGPQSDVFSLGAIFHHLLIQKALFEGKKPEQVLTKNRNFEMDLKSSDYDLVDSEAMSLLQKMLEVDPADRIKSHQALRHQFFTYDIKPYSPVSTVCYQTQKQIAESLSF